MIYSTSEIGLKKEIQICARTLNNIYDSEFHGDFSDSTGHLKKGGFEITNHDFERIVRQINCVDDVDFTIFWGDERVFTSIRNKDGTSVAGTRADKAVVDKVLVEGQEFYYRRVNINERYYLGYYIPIMNAQAQVVGMYFAGIALDSAMENTVLAMLFFALIGLITMWIFITVFHYHVKGLTDDIADINQYLEKIAHGDFNAEIKQMNKQRNDEIGEIVRHAEKLCVNLKDMVENDPLTGLLNRRSCHNKLEELKQEGTVYTVVMGDIDFFKKINDTYGHACGDIVLKNVSQFLKDSAEKYGGWASRWGGEEFLIVYPDKNEDQVRAYMEELMNKLRKMDFEYKGKVLRVTMTLGVSACENDDENSDKAINRADKLLYKGKSDGRDRVVFNTDNDQ